jgi:hypothetical protein
VAHGQSARLVRKVRWDISFPSSYVFLASDFQKSFFGFSDSPQAQVGQSVACLFHRFSIGFAQTVRVTLTDSPCVS